MPDLSTITQAERIRGEIHLESYRKLIRNKCDHFNLCNFSYKNGKYYPPLLVLSFFPVFYIIAGA